MSILPPPQKKKKKKKKIQLQTKLMQEFELQWRNTHTHMTYQF